jgi:CRP/FNR family transcriptional regulator, cyclic AMP receptor protein
MKPTITQRITSEPALRALANAARHRSHSRRQVVIEEGTKPESLFLLLSGTIVITSVSGPHELLLGYKYPGEFFGEMGMFPEVAPLRSARLSALSACTFLEIGYGRFRELVRAHPELWEAIAEQLARDLRAVNRRLAEMPVLHAAERIWQVLLHLAAREERRDLDSCGIPVRIKRSDLGKLAGCSREVAGLVLHELAREGRVRLKGHAIVVCA